MDNGLTVRRLNKPESEKQIAELWVLLEQAKNWMEMLTPLRQNPNEEEFREKLSHSSIMLFLLFEGNELIGFTLNTNELSMATWMNEKFYAFHCPQLFQQKKIWLNITMALRQDKQKKGFLKKLLTATYLWGTSEGRVMIVDYSARLLGEGFAKFMVDFGQGQEKVICNYGFYDQQLFTVIWQPDQVANGEEVGKLTTWKNR